MMNQVLVHTSYRNTVHFPLILTEAPRSTLSSYILVIPTTPPSLGTPRDLWDSCQGFERGTNEVVRDYTMKEMSKLFINSRSVCNHLSICQRQEYHKFEVTPLFSLLTYWYINDNTFHGVFFSSFTPFSRPPPYRPSTFIRGTPQYVLSRKVTHLQPDTSPLPREDRLPPRRRNRKLRQSTKSRE